MLLNYRRLRKQPEVVELNITAFLALMVILVPFLLLTVVFTPHSVIETPLTNASNTPPDPVIQPLVITLRDNTIVIDDFSGEQQTLSDDSDRYNMAQLSLAMQTLKARFPDETKARLLLDETVSYADTLDAMQAVAGWRYRINGGVKEYPLFPQISRGLAAPTEAVDSLNTNTEDASAAAQPKREVSP